MGFASVRGAFRNTRDSVRDLEAGLQDSPKHSNVEAAGLKNLPSGGGSARSCCCRLINLMLLLCLVGVIIMVGMGSQKVKNIAKKGISSSRCGVVRKQNTITN